MTYEEEKAQILELKALPLDVRDIKIGYSKTLVVGFLRKAQVTNLRISSINDEAKEEELRTLLRSIVIEKFKKIAQNFSDKQLEKMLCFISRGYVKFPLDLTVIDDAVFVKEADIGDFGDLLYYKTLMYCNLDFFLIFDDLDFNFPSTMGEMETNYSKEELIKFFDFICESINKALMPIYHKEVAKPIYKLNRNGIFYGYTGVAHTSFETQDVTIYINRKSYHIMRDIEEKRACELKMIVLDGAKEEASLYIITQSFENGIVNWKIEKSPEKPWILTQNVG